MNILFIGPEGSGKTSHAHTLVGKYDFHDLDIGELIREASHEPTRKAELMDHLANKKGRLLPDGVVVDILIDDLYRNGFDNVIFDGYPRTLNQYHVLIDLLHSKGSKIDVAFYLNISDEEAVQRVRQRNRPDDEPQAIASRVEQFHRDTQPVLEEMLRDGIAVPIESSAPMEVVQKQIADKLQEINGKLDPKRQLKPRTSDEVILRVVSQSEPKVEGEFRTLFVITHSESDYNKKGIFTGLTEVELTEEGHKKAELSAQILRKEKIDLVVKTSMIRTGQTLEHIMKYHPDTKVETDDRFIERDYGELSGLSKDQYAKDHPDLYPIYHRSYDVPPPGGESMKSVEERALAALHEILDRIKKDKINVLIVCHSNSIRPIRRYFEHLTPEEMMQLEHLRHQIFTYKIPV